MTKFNACPNYKISSNYSWTKRKEKKSTNTIFLFLVFFSKGRIFSRPRGCGWLKGKRTFSRFPLLGINSKLQKATQWKEKSLNNLPCHPSVSSSESQKIGLCICIWSCSAGPSGTDWPSIEPDCPFLINVLWGSGVNHHRLGQKKKKDRHPEKSDIVINTLFSCCNTSTGLLTHTIWPCNQPLHMLNSSVTSTKF